MAEPTLRFRLPIFPLPVVLFPTAVLPLHIFEPRYRRMVTRCLDSDRRFGLVYHDPDDSGPFLLEEGRVGCVAMIQDFQPLPDGRSLLVARGADRFHIVDGIESTEPFNEALVEAYDDHSADVEVLERERRRTLALFDRVVRTLVTGGQTPPEVEVGDEVSFRLVRAIEVEPHFQQAFLELRDERLRLKRLDAIFEATLDA